MRESLAPSACSQNQSSFFLAMTRWRGTCTIVDEEVEVASAGALGRGEFAKVVLRKGKIAAEYMGNMCFRTGILAMQCLKMKALILALPDPLRNVVEKTKYDSTLGRECRKQSKFFHKQ